MSGEGKGGSYDESRKVTYEVVLHVSDERDVYSADDLRAAIERALIEADQRAWTGKLFWGGWELRSVREVPLEIEWAQVTEMCLKPAVIPAAWEALNGTLRVEAHPLTPGKFLAIVTLDDVRHSPGVFPQLEFAQRETEKAFENWKGN